MRVILAEDSVLLSFDQSAILELLQHSPRFARGMIQVLCDRIADDTAAVAEARTRTRK